MDPKYCDDFTSAPQTLIAAVQAPIEPRALMIDLAVLGAMELAADPRGCCTLHLRALALQLGMAPATVRRALRRLLDRGWILSWQEEADGGETYALMGAGQQGLG